jgi:hypothetical protein
MSYTSGSAVLHAMVASVASPYALWPSISSPSSAAFESANRAVYAPIRVPGPCVVRRLWWANGATVSASYNVDCGIYADSDGKPGAKLVSSGSTAQGTASQVQFVDVTDTTLAPGIYWLALTCSSLSATFFRTIVAANWDASARLEEASALPLPASATPAESSGTNLYYCGFATTASP